jgi:hypothetical protein
MHPLERRVQGVKGGEERFFLTTHQMMSILEKESTRHKIYPLTPPSLPVLGGEGRGE